MALIDKIKQLQLIKRNKKLIRKILPKSEKHLEYSILGSISLDDELGIKQAVMLAEKFDGPIIEIGTLFGHTTNLIASLARPDTKIITVDNFKWNPFSLTPEMHKIFTERTLRYILDRRNTTLVAATASAFYQAYEGSKPSLVFIDADHSYESVKQDIKWAIEIGIPVISGHDYSDQHPGIKKAVQECFGDNFSVYGTVWVVCERIKKDS